jgi:hypothetical protein
MKCLRCGGAMVRDKFYSPTDWFWGLKCVICGEIIDPLILKNRLSMDIVREISQPQKRRSVARLARARNQLNPSMDAS